MRWSLDRKQSNRGPCSKGCCSMRSTPPFATSYQHSLVIYVLLPGIHRVSRLSPNLHNAPLYGGRRRYPMRQIETPFHPHPEHEQSSSSDRPPPASNRISPIQSFLRFRDAKGWLHVVPVLKEDHSHMHVPP